MPTQWDEGWANRNAGLEQYARNTGGVSGGVTASPISPGGSDQIAALTKMINDLNIEAQNKANANRIPGGAGLEATSSGNIANALAGNVDPSVIRKLGEQSATRGVMTGSPGGPSTNADYLRSLGLTSLDLQNTGQNWLTQATGRNPGAPVYNAGNQVLTAEQQAQLDMERQRLALERERMNRIPLGGGGGGGGYQGGGAPVTGSSPGPNYTNPAPWYADNRNSLFGGGGGGSNTFAPFDSGANWQDATGADWNWGSPSGGGTLATGTGGIDDFLWNNASDTTGTTDAYDYNWDEFGGYG